RSPFRAAARLRAETTLEPQEPVLPPRRGHPLHRARGGTLRRALHGADRSRLERPLWRAHGVLRLLRHDRRPAGRRRLAPASVGVAAQPWDEEGARALLPELERG